MTQLALQWLDEADARRVVVHADMPRARRLDVATSHAAAEKAAKFAGKHEATCFAAICDAGDYGCTYLEIALKTGMEPVAVGRRLGAMGSSKRRPAVIRRNGQKRGGCMVWVASK